MTTFSLLCRVVLMLMLMHSCRERREHRLKEEHSRLERKKRSYSISGGLNLFASGILSPSLGALPMQSPAFTFSLAASAQQPSNNNNSSNSNTHSSALPRDSASLGSFMPMQAVNMGLQPNLAVLNAYLQSAAAANSAGLGERD